MNEPLITMTNADWQRGQKLSELYMAVGEPSWEVNPFYRAAMKTKYPASHVCESGGPEWNWGRMSAIADGLPGLVGIGPLKTAAFVMAEQRHVNRDELVHDETAIRLHVRAWLAGRGINTTDDPPEDAA